MGSEGIDFSDCVEKADLVARAALHLPGAAEPWDAAPEHTLLVEPPKKPRSELAKECQQRTVAQAHQNGSTAHGSIPQQTVLKSGGISVQDSYVGAATFDDAAIDCDPMP